MKTLDEILAEFTALETENANLREQLAAGSPTHAGNPAQLAALTAERDALKAEVGTLKQEVTTLKANQTEFDRNVAAAVARHGIATVGIGTSHSKASGATADDVNKLIKRAEQRAKAHMPASL